MFFACDMTVGEREDAIRHFSHHGIMRNDQRERAEFAIDPLDRFKNCLPGAHIKRSRGLIAHENGGAFRDGTSDRDPLLFTTRKLRGKMIHAGPETHHVQRFFWSHRISGDLRDERDVLSSGQARD